MAIGNGTTADAVRHEMLTGLPTLGRFHFEKSQLSLNGLNGLNGLIGMKPLTLSDHQSAVMLRNELIDVLGGR